MAALGLESGGHVWGGERVDLLDSFDSEMQEWEDQLQEMQNKIEELFSEVKARREASENGTEDKSLDITLLPVNSECRQRANGYFHGPSDNIRPVRQCRDTAVGFQHPNGYCNGSKFNPPSNGGHFPASCHDIERQGATLDILNGYLEQGSQFGNIQRNLRTPNANQKVHPVVHNYPENIKTSSVTNRTFEDIENTKNKKAKLDESHSTRKGSISGKNLPLENFVNKQRDAPPVPPRSLHHDSQRQPDRKCLLVDRKSGSPSVLRKFGAMLQENEGKTLIEDGVVTTVIPTERLASAPVCQRKMSFGRASPRMPIQRCQTDCASNASPSHKAKEHKMAFRGEDLFSDYRMVERILGAGAHVGIGVDARWESDNLDQLLDMMELENNTNQRATFAQQKQVSRESSPAPHPTSFSRPARPANQRRPTRWATPTPSGRITPKSCPSSPSVKGRRFLNSYSLHTETVIM